MAVEGCGQQATLTPCKPDNDAITKVNLLVTNQIPRLPVGGRGS